MKQFSAATGPGTLVTTGCEVKCEEPMGRRELKQCMRRGHRTYATTELEVSLECLVC